VTSVGENEEKANTIQPPPLLVFFSPSIGIRAMVLLRTLNSVTVQDLIMVILMLFLMIMVIRKLIHEKFQSSMEIQKSSLGGKPTLQLYHGLR